MTELALHILDIIENSVNAEAMNISCSITEDVQTDSYEIRIIDDGKGMDTNTLGKAEDPFFTTRTTRKAGLGISLFKMAAIQSGGHFNIISEPGKGTEVVANMQLQHIDRQPLGDISGVMVQLFCSYPGIRFIYTHKTPFGRYEFDTQKIKEIIGDITHINNEIRNFIKDMIRENLDEIKITK